MDKRSKWIWQPLAVLVVIAVGGGGFKILKSQRVLPEPKPKDVMAPLVEVVTARPQSARITVTGYGTVEPRMEVQVVPQVSGRVVMRHEQFVAGGTFDANTPLVIIEQRDYKIALQAAQATVAQAEVNLAREQAEAEVAMREWRTMNPGREPDSILVFREPQVHSAEAQLRSARAQLEKAQLDLERTEISMPFAGRVINSFADRGQFVTQGQAIGSVYAADAVEISVPLKDEELAWFVIPGGDPVGEETDVEALVTASFAGRAQQWSGRIVRMKSQVDARSRLVHVIVQVDEPFVTEGVGRPLLPGMFVTVTIQGKTVENVIPVPRHAVRQDGRIWIARAETAEEETPNDPNAPNGDYAHRRLTMRPVSVLRQDRDTAYIDDGLQTGEAVIVTALDTVTEGMKIRLMIDPASSEAVP